jgi:hypothetical protein
MNILTKTHYPIKPFTNTSVKTLLRKLAIILLAFPLWLCSQTDTLKRHKLDSLTKKLRADSAHTYRDKKVRPYFSIDNRNSYIAGRKAQFGGLQLGVILYEEHVLGIGLYAITQKSKANFRVLDDSISAQKSVSLNYFTFFYNVNLFEREHFGLALPVELGLGGYDIKLENAKTGRIYRNNKGGIILTGIGIQPTWMPLPWVGLSLLVGVRVVLDNATKENFNGLYYNFGLNFDIRQIYRDIKYRGFIRKKYRREVKKLIAS